MRVDASCDLSPLPRELIPQNVQHRSGERAKVRGIVSMFQSKRDPSSGLRPPSPLTNGRRDKGEFSEFTVSSFGFVARLESVECLISHRAKNISGLPVSTFHSRFFLRIMHAPCASAGRANNVSVFEARAGRLLRVKGFQPLFQPVQSGSKCRPWNCKAAVDQLTKVIAAFKFPMATLTKVELSSIDTPQVFTRGLYRAAV